MDEFEAMLRLVAAGGAGAPRQRLLRAAGSAVGALEAGATTWRAMGLDPAQCARLAAPDRDLLARGLAWRAASPAHHLLAIHDPAYPELLRATAQPPVALFVAGDPMLLWRPAVAIVGSRAPSPGGRDTARAFARALAARGLAVASGLAAGIDAAAHAGALDAGGTTFAVLGSGIDVPYPRSCRDLHARIAAAGAVASELPPGTPARPEQFPSRNRIVAGLSLGTLVVEAARRSGALITARLAADAGREVMAVPGSIHNPKARGCHRLLRDGAALVESPEEVAALLAPLAGGLADALRARIGAPIDAPCAAAGDPGESVWPEGSDYNRLWQALGHDPTGMDQLVERTGLTAAGVSATLLLMELDGRVAVKHGRYSRQSCNRAPTGAGRGK